MVGTSTFAPDDIVSRVSHFYDMASPYYFQLYGPNIHDGYYLTGKETLPQAQEELVRMLATKARIAKGSNLLDVGCGVGGSSIWLARKLGVRPTGITISPVQVETARRLAQEAGVDASFLLMDASQMSFDHGFDCLWMVAMTTHLLHQEQVLDRALGYLETGGRIVIFDWMVAEETPAADNDPDVAAVAEGMLLASLYSLNTYLGRLTARGCRITYAEDITGWTAKTWDDVLAAMRDRAAWRLALRATLQERSELLRFLRCIRPMKRAMARGLLLAGAIVAEKR